MSLNRNDIINKDDRRYKLVDMRQWWGDDVRIKSLSIHDQQLCEKARGADNEQFALTLIKCACVDDEGNRLFNDGDIELLSEKDGDAIACLFKECIDFCIIKDQDIEQHAKN